MPGSNRRAVNKARSLAADVVVVDLEDAVAPEAKADARAQVVAEIGQGGFGRREVIVRVNALDTVWGAADLEAVAPLAVDGVLLPKVESPDQVREAASRLDGAGGGALPLWVMVETPAGVINAPAIAAAGDRLRCLVLGTSDLGKDMRLPPDESRLGLLSPLSWCVAAARAAGLDVLDGVHLDIADGDGFRRLCEQGRRLGFDGKTLIHPDQIAAANEIFGPTDEEVDSAREIIDAWERARRDGQGVAVVRGRLVENLHVEAARRTLDLYEIIAG